MSTSAEPWQPILDALTQLRTAWPARDWSWDHRFKCVTSSLPSEAAPAAKGILVAAVPSEWDAASFASAPEPVRALAERCGEVRPGQALLTASPVGGMTLFAMWWPWGDGSKVSIRLGIANSDRQKELYPLVRSLFAIP
ncbi:MAG TPA: hypothetical protein VGP07_12030 [Polyangia bacterium]|jgi:hypothetical protein